MTMRCSPLFLLAAVLVLSCGFRETVYKVPLYDGEDIDDSKLHPSYAAGSRVRIEAPVSPDRRPALWRLRSDRPSLFAIDRFGIEAKNSDVRLVAECVVGVEGTATLVLIDDEGAERARESVSVAVPDRVWAVPYGPARLAWPDRGRIKPVEEARVLSGATAAFALATFRGEQRLYGHGAVEIAAPDGLTAQREITNWRPASDWLLLTPAQDGDYAVELRIQGRAAATLRLTAVPETAIASLKLEQSLPDPYKFVTVLLRALDAEQRDIFGVYADWIMPQPAPSRRYGDLFVYQARPTSAPIEVVAHRGSHEARIAINADPGALWSPTQTKSLGCSAVPGGSGGATPLPLALVGWLGGLLGLLLRQRCGRVGRDEPPR